MILFGRGGSLGTSKKAEDQPTEKPKNISNQKEIQKSSLDIKIEKNDFIIIRANEKAKQRVWVAEAIESPRWKPSHFNIMCYKTATVLPQDAYVDGYYDCVDDYKSTIFH